MCADQAHQPPASDFDGEASRLAWTISVVLHCLLVLALLAVLTRTSAGPEPVRVSVKLVRNDDTNRPPDPTVQVTHANEALNEVSSDNKKPQAEEVRLADHEEQKAVAKKADAQKPESPKVQTGSKKPDPASKTASPLKADAQKKAPAKTDAAANLASLVKDSKKPKGKENLAVAPDAGRKAFSKGTGSISQDGDLVIDGAYLDGLHSVIRRYFRPPPESQGVVSVRFTLRRDGSLADMKIVKRSGGILLDMAGMQAIEAAAERHEFQPLPRNFKGESLTIIFDFKPVQ